jgi:Histidyl-tRNA synthetase
MDSIKGIKGVKDILPEETPRWRFIEDAARRWALRYGYQEIRIPIFEFTALFARSIGSSTDIVEKEMYTFPDRDGTSLTLRPEGTAGTVRAFIEHNRAADPLPQKYFYLGPMFRHERPQAGRLGSSINSGRIIRHVGPTRRHRGHCTAVAPAIGSGSARPHTRDQ